MDECEEEEERRRLRQKSRNAARFEVSCSYREPKFISPGWSDPVTQTHIHHLFSFACFTFTFFLQKSVCFCREACNVCSVSVHLLNEIDIVNLSYKVIKNQFVLCALAIFVL